MDFASSLYKDRSLMFRKWLNMTEIRCIELLEICSLSWTVFSSFKKDILCYSYSGIFLSNYKAKKSGWP